METEKKETKYKTENTIADIKNLVGWAQQQTEMTEDRISELEKRTIEITDLKSEENTLTFLIIKIQSEDFYLTTWNIYVFSIIPAVNNLKNLDTLYSKQI